MRKYLYLLLLLLPATFASAQELESHWDIPNGTVNAIVREGNTVYLGGTFTSVGPVAPYGVPVDLTTGVPDFSFANPNGYVSGVASDGSGGWFIAGSFTQVGGVTRNRLAHLDNTGAVTAWNPNANNAIVFMTKSGNIIYIGGEFTDVGGAARTRIAAIDATTGLATSWDPNANGRVRSIIVDGTTVYACGDFNTIGGESRSYIAALDATTGLATAWNPTSNSLVYAMNLSGSTVYVLGAFSTIGGQSRSRIAALETSTGNATSWAPSVGPGAHFSILADNDTIYIGGSFSTAGGQSRNNLAALSATTGLAYDWNPSPTGTVYGLYQIGNTLYVGGDFNSIGGETRVGLAAFDVTTGSATAWNPVAGGIVAAMASDGTDLYAGGGFISIGGQARSRIAALNATTGKLTSWNPGANNVVNTLAVSGSDVYVGGTFTSIGGQSRNRIAAIDVTSGLATAWDPNSGNTVNTIAVGGDTVYAGGSFTSIGGQSRNRIAALNVSDGLATAWDPNASSTVKTILVDGNTLYVGGDFTSIGGESRNRIAAFDATTGAATAWNPNSDGSINGIVKHEGLIYACGVFTTIGGQSRVRVAALDPATGAAGAFNPNGHFTVNSVAVAGSSVFVGGNFNTMGGQSRNRLAALDITTGNATDWNPNPSNDVKYVYVHTNTLYVGGQFSTITGQTRPNFAVFILPATWTGATDTDWATTTNWSPSAVPTATDNVLIPDVSGASGNFPTVSNTGAEANAVTVASAATLTIGATGDLTIHGNLSNSGTVIVGAEGSGIGSLITLGTISGTGTFQADQYLQGDGGATPNGVFQYVSSPVVGATSTTYDAEGDNKLWSANEATQDYTEIEDNVTVLNVGEGYVARMGTNGTVTAQGTAFHTGDVDIENLTRSTGPNVNNRGYNLIGNPYPSSVNWSNATKTNVETTLWYRTHTAGNVMIAETYNATLGEGTNNGNYTGQAAVGIIPPGQAFWVRVVDGETEGSVSFTNIMRSHGTQSGIYKQEAEEGTVRLHLSNGILSDETIVHFNSEAMDSYDDFDSQKMWMNNLPQLYTATGTDSLTINGLFSIETNPMVDLGYKAPATGEYTITASSITLSEEVWLEDRLLNNFQHLNMNPVYAFTTNQGNIGDRFALHFGEMAVVGVEENGSATHVFAADGVVNVSVGNDITTGMITILDMAGRTVQTAAINGSRTVVATDLITGIYLVRVETEKGAETHRVMLR